MVYLNTVITFFIPLFLIFVFRNALQAMGKTLMPLMAGVFELGGKNHSFVHTSGCNRFWGV